MPICIIENFFTDLELDCKDFFPCENCPRSDPNRKFQILTPRRDLVQ